MGHSCIGVTMNTYTHLGPENAQDEMRRIEGMEQARDMVDRPVTRRMFKAV